MISLWWLALAVLALPVWWHRQKRQRVNTEPMATARFLPRTDPQQQRVWRWTDRFLLLVRCLLLATVIAWLADLVLPWRSDAVLVAPGTDAAWAEQQIKDAGFKDASRIALDTADAFGWLARHEREWQADARLLVLGQVAMPAARPRLAHTVQLRARSIVPPAPERHIVIASAREAAWRKLFSALPGAQRYHIDSEATASTDLIIWDRAQAPPAGLRAPLWWLGDSSAFPEIKEARQAGGLRYADSPRGRLWFHPAWPAASADAARAQFETWQSLHYAPPVWPVATQTIVATPGAIAVPGSGALRYLLTIALLVLFALERILTHANRR